MKLRSQEQKDSSKIGRSFVLIIQIGLSMMTAIFVGLFIGMWLDRIFKTQYLTIVFLFFGFAAAIRNVYYLTKRYYRKDLDREESEQKYISSLMNNKNLSDKEREMLLKASGLSSDVSNTIHNPKVRRNCMIDEFNKDQIENKEIKG